MVISGLWYWGLLAPITALAFGVVLLKFGFILARKRWYQVTPIQTVAMLETVSAVLFLAIAAISLLPAYLAA